MESTCIIIPTYNNQETIINVVQQACRYCLTVIVVDDGSTDNTRELLSAQHGICVVESERNYGKGHALKMGFRQALSMGFDFAITMDADGQHYACDIPKFLAACQKHPNALIVGSRNLQSDNMPVKNTFANKFSNFWFFVQTLQWLPDTQTGFRLYPLNRMGGLRWLTSRYEAELEMLVWAAWKGVKLCPIKVNVYYPPSEQRVSHFRPFYDFLRISILNTFLCLAAVVYGYPQMLINKLQK